MVASACAGAPGTRPDEMSVAGHEAAAVQWESAAKASPEDLARFKKAHEVAAQHRVAAQTLVDAEARACSGVAIADRDISPFSRRQEIEAIAIVGPRATNSVNGYDTADRGAAVTFRAVPGLTREWFQRILNCHQARNAALGYPAGEMLDCPLNLKGVDVVVESAGPRFVVEVTSDDPTMAREILRRAQRDAGLSVQR
jgi:hypothetical protein